MNDFVINLFIPPTIEGSAVAILAHMYAHENDGIVSIVRCSCDEYADYEIKELLHHITMADGYNAPQPKHREIWYADFRLKTMTKDELMWYSDSKLGRNVEKFSSIDAEQILLDSAQFMAGRSIGFASFVNQLYVPDNDYLLLYNMLEPDEYEHLLAYLLRKHPNAKDVIKEDYVLNMFVEHKKKKTHLK